MIDDQIKDIEENTKELVLREAWFTEAKEQTLETLPAFLQKLAEYEHSYGTICRAVAAAALGAAWAMEHSPQGGITGFQASYVMWDFMSGWMSWPTDDLARRLLNMEDLLYPQYESRFTTIEQKTRWKVRERAKKLLDAKPGHVSDSVRKHWQSIVDGRVPFGLRISVRDF